MATQSKEVGTTVWIKPDRLVMSAQVRTADIREDKSYKDFLASIKLHGVMQPIIARKKGAEYHVIAGHRRTTAALDAELDKVPVYVSEVTDDELIARQLVENIQREDMTLADIADGVWRLYNGPADGVARIVAEMLGKSKAWVSKMLLLSAPGKAHAVARSLMAKDKLHDIEVAYLICQVEELDRPSADTIAENIDTETRATIKARLAALQTAAGKAPKAAAEGDGTGEEPGPDDDTQGFTVEEWTYLQRVVTEAVAPPADMAVKKRVLAIIKGGLEALDGE